ncbi:MAG TPA: di-heme-cytochrome C peroxidase [Vicinamibacterales bacterium]
MSKKKNIAIFTVILFIAVGAGLIGLLMTGAYKVAMDTVADPVQTSRDVKIDNHTLTEAELDRFYHLSQGSQVMPYDWFINLEQGDNTEKLTGDAFMSRFRFIPSRKSDVNPDALQIGFAKDDPDPINGSVNMGVTCAACHTAQITYKGASMLVNGGPGQIDFDKFVAAMYASLAITANSPLKADRFARAVLKDKFSIRAAADLWVDVQASIARTAQQKAEEALSNRNRKEESTEGGFGRIDALGAGGNSLYRRLGTQNLRALNAPVKALPLWYATDYDWVQTNGSIRSPLHRNVIESLAVNASLVFPGDKAKNNQFLASSRLKNMVELEKLMSTFSAPKWPEDVLGKLDQARIARGETHYKNLCASCHEPKIEATPLSDDAAAVRGDKRYLVVSLHHVDAIGTDPTDAVNFARRTLDATAIGMKADTPGANIIAMVLGGIVTRGLDDLKITGTERDQWIGNRENLLRACEAYPARPLAGYWAAGPYLHNGSIPTLYDLLTPAAQRPKEFFTGNLEFDPVKVGRVTTDFQGSFLFKTNITGNSNAGHEFGTTLSQEEKMDLIEFLKQVPPPGKDLPTVDPSYACPAPPAGNAKSATLR